MTKIIPLTRGYFTYVDDEDFQWLSRMAWHAQHPNTRWVYATHSVRIRLDCGRHSCKTVHMHRLIINAEDGQLVDHRNGNTLDNRRSNLRTATHMTNGQNSRWSSGKSSYKGVQWRKERNKYRAVITVNGRRITLGLFASDVEAALAYDAAARQSHGEFALLNFPERL